MQLGLLSCDQPRNDSRPLMSFIFTELQEEVVEPAGKTLFLLSVVEEFEVGRHFVKETVVELKTLLGKIVAELMVFFPFLIEAFYPLTLQTIHPRTHLISTSYPLY